MGNIIVFYCVYTVGLLFLFINHCLLKYIIYDILYHNRSLPLIIVPAV